MERTRKGYEVFHPFLDGHEKEIENLKEFVTEVRDLKDFSRKIVTAKISKDPAKLPDGEELWVKDAKENILPIPWRIQIVREMDEETPVTRSEIEERKEFYSVGLAKYYAGKEMTKIEEERRRRMKSGETER